MPYVHVNGERVYVRRTGAQPSLLLLHGAYDNSKLWQQMSNELHDIECVAVDLPAHGWSDGDALRSQAQYVDFIHSLIDELAIKSPILCGHSMGGSMALAYAAARLGPVRAVIAISSAPDWSIDQKDIDLWARDPDRAFEENDSVMFSSITSVPVRASYAAQLRSSRPSTCAADLEACRSFDLQGKLSDLSIPVAVIYGSDEYWKSGSKSLLAGLPAATEFVVDGGGHAVIWEQPAGVASRIRVFLSSLPSSR